MAINEHAGVNGEPIQDSFANPPAVYEGGVTNKTKAVTITDIAALVSWTGAVVGQVINSGAQTVYIGGEDVTSSNGWPVAAGLREGHGRPELWAVCATGETSTLIVWDEVV